MRVLSCFSPLLFSFSQPSVNIYVVKLDPTDIPRKSQSSIADYRFSVSTMLLSKRSDSEEVFWAKGYLVGSTVVGFGSGEYSFSDRGLK